MSSNYGVTPTGFIPKRMDAIYKEEHQELSKAWGFNTMENPESFLNVLLTVQADRLAELWEVMQEVYHSFYPSSAQGISLDNAVQFAGLRRIADQNDFLQHPLHRGRWFCHSGRHADFLHYPAADPVFVFGG